MSRYQKRLHTFGRQLVAVNGAIICAVVLVALLLFWLWPANTVQADSTLYIPAVSHEQDTDDYIAYGFNGNLIVINADGQSAPRVLASLSDQFDEIFPRWSEDNRKIHYWYGSEVEGYAFVTVPFDGASPTTSISFTLPGDFGFAVWSPDGSRALLSHSGSSTDTFWIEIYSIRANGTGLQKLLTTSGDVSNLSWSPDGTQILYSNFVSGTVHILNADGGNPNQSDEPLVMGVYPVWSPDGTQIAFSRSNSDGYADIYTINVDGGNLRNLTESNDFNDLAPAWSPDGTQIAFVTYRNDNWFLYVMNADGSNPVPLYSEPGFYQPNLQWSPDGDKIAFIKDFVVGYAASILHPDVIIPVTERDLGVLEIASQKETRLTFREQSPYRYAWSN